MKWGNLMDSKKVIAKVITKLNNQKKEIYASKYDDLLRELASKGKLEEFLKTSYHPTTFNSDLNNALTKLLGRPIKETAGTLNSMLSKGIEPKYQKIKSSHKIISKKEKAIELEKDFENLKKNIILKIKDNHSKDKELLNCVEENFNTFEKTLQHAQMELINPHLKTNF